MKATTIFSKIRDAIRKEKIEKYGYWFCDKCKTNDTYHCSMHHIVYKSEKPKHEHLHNAKNLIDLCEKCHRWFHKKKDRRNFLVKLRNLKELFKDE